MVLKLILFLDDLPKKYKSALFLSKTIRTDTSKNGKKSIIGLAILDKEFFVVYEENSEVEVYDSIQLSLNRRLDVTGLFHPRDIGSCNQNKCLYIFSCKFPRHSHEILRVDRNGNLIKKWSTGDDYGFGLFVTDEMNVILAVFNENKLNEYSSDGQLIREIILSSHAGISYPFKAIKLTNGHFVVSHGYDDNDELHRVCAVDVNGKLKKTFGGKLGSTIGKMHYPVDLSVDGNGFIFVADRLNSRVLLLDSDLKFTREILSKDKHGLRRPSKILLDKSNGRLFVADNELNNNRIVVFDFSRQITRRQTIA